MATYVISATVPGDDKVRILGGADTDWLTARSAPSPSVVFFMYVNGGSWGGSGWLKAQSFLEFDTSSLSSSDAVVSSGMRLTTSSDWNTADAWTMRARANATWSYPLSTSDVVPGANLTSYSVMGSVTVPTTRPLVLSMSLTGINAGGVTKLFLHGSQWESTSAPSQVLRYAEFASPGLTSGPRLIVHTVQPSTLMGVHDAAVQLSDGSTVYLESDGAAGPPLLKQVDTSGSVSSWSYPNWTPTEDWLGYSYDGLQNHTLAVDASDNVYWVWGDAYNDIWIWAFDSDGQYLGYSGGGGQGGRQTNIAAVWCDAGNGDAGAGRLLIAYASNFGVYRYTVVDANRALTDRASGSTTDFGVANPSWLVSSSNFRNLSGTGLSLATDVFGGTRVGVFSWSNNALTSTSGDVTYQTRAAELTVGSSISSVSTYSWDSTTSPTTSTSFDPNGHRAKVVGVGSNQFVAVWQAANALSARRIGTPTTAVATRPDFFDVVFDENGEAVWAYYFSGNDLVRLPYYPATGAWGTALTVTTDETATKDFIRTVKRLRDPLYSEVHYNRTA